MKVALVVLILAIAKLTTSSHHDLRITEGEIATDGQFPYIVSLRYVDEHRCGGIILDNSTILIAAQCVSQLMPGYMVIVAGSNKLNEGGDHYKIKYFKINNDYGFNNQLGHVINDIAIIELWDPIQFNEKIKPIELRTDIISDEEDCVLSGWGSQSINGNYSNELQFINMKTIDSNTCSKVYNMEIFEGEICTLNEAGSGLCYGDAGGPLVDLQNRLVGIASWGTPCGYGKPEVFTRIALYLDWIEKNRDSWE